MATPLSASAEDGFNPAFLEHLGAGNDVADLSAFTQNADGQAPGKYIVDIYINGEPVDHQEVAFYSDKASTDGTGLSPCLTLDQLKKFGLKEEAATAMAKDHAPAKGDIPEEAKECSQILKSIPAASSTFEFSQQRLNLSIPQAVLAQSARGYVDPSLWDNGIPAFLLDYNFTGANGQNKGSGGDSKDNSYYLSLRNGFNYGPWRFRNYSTWNDNNGERSWQNVNTYLQRSLVGLKSQLTIGDGYSSSDVFDSLQFRGVQMASDDEMLPDSQQGFAPVVRGIAKSNAQVTIKQNGYTIYQSYVAAGAFEITDLYPSSGSGDLDVVIKEEDGSEQHFVQPYSTVAILQREGRTKYSLTAGQYRSGYNSDNPEFAQFSIIHGFSKGLTLYTGMQGSKDYASLALGLGENFGDLGAVSFDVTQARTKLESGDESTGQSYRFLYSKTFSGTDTDFRLLGYRYSTSGYYSLQESMDLNSNNTDTSDFDANNHKRSQIQGSVSQTLGENFGSLYLTASVQDYWAVSGKEKTIQWGYSDTWNGISFNLSYSNNYTPEQPTDRQVSMSISLPLDKWLSGTWASYSMNSSSKGYMQQQAGINGTLLEDKNLSYSVSQEHGNQGQGYSGNASVNYQGSKGNSNLGYSYNNNSTRWNYGVEGGVVLHSGGLTLAQPLGETIALVEAPGAGDSKVMDTIGVTTDGRGYAVIPYISPYRRNKVGLDTTTLGANVDMDESAKDVIPTRGAVVRARFNTHVGYRVMMTLTRPGGKTVPFGATVSLASSGSDEAIDAGIVGEQGETYLNGLPEKGQLVVQWGKEAGNHCTVNYQLSKADLSSAMPALTGTCQ